MQARIISVGVLCSVILKLTEANACSTYDNKQGSCLKVINCNYLVALLSQTFDGKDALIDGYLKRSLCGYDGFDLMICCPIQGPVFSTTPPTTFAPMLFFFSPLFPLQAPTLPPTIQNRETFDSLPTFLDNGCGISSTPMNRVVGGNNARLNSWPWIAALGYRIPFEIDAKYLCGGSLITQKHILTAAHCVKESLVTVRLGEHDIVSDADGAYPVDIPIDLKIVHEDFNSKLIINDIGLLKLTQNAPFTEKIRPICLPISEPMRSRDYTNYQPFVIGWGSTSFRGPTANVLQEIQLPVIALSTCESSYRSKFPGQIFDGRVICAGDPSGASDACQGDSGGPLMLPQLSGDNSVHYFNQLGIVSYGFECARAGYPGVYTRVGAYVPWIQQHLND